MESKKNKVKVKIDQGNVATSDTNDSKNETVKKGHKKSTSQSDEIGDLADKLPCFLNNYEGNKNNV